MNVHTNFGISNIRSSSPELWSGSTKLVGAEPADEFRVIKWNLLARAQSPGLAGRNPRTVLVTSARPNEGKTFVARNLVASLALGGETDVTLIDTDFLNPGLPSSTFTGGHHKGLLDLLADDDLNLRSAMLDSNKTNVHFLAAGRPRANIPEMLNSKRMLAVLDEITGSSIDSMAVIDGGAVLTSSEPSRLAQYCGHILFVVSENKTRKDDIDSALSLLDQLAGPIDHTNFSFVFNKTS